jgi:hypothetical protein
MPGLAASLAGVALLGVADASAQLDDALLRVGRSRRTNPRSMFEER